MGLIGIVAGALRGLAIAVDAGGDIVADDVDFVAAAGEFAGDPDCEMFGGAAGGVEMFNDEGDFHRALLAAELARGSPADSPPAPARMSAGR